MYQFLGTTRSQVLLWQPKICFKAAASIIISALLLGAPHLCQGSTEINGKVIDKATEQPIFGAVVKIESDGQISAETTTDKDGNFRLVQDVQGKEQIQVSSIGYNRYSEMLAIASDSAHNLEIASIQPNFPVCTDRNYR